MSTHEEAKLAMDSLTRTQLKGHCLDISWAVVQRSGGFLDGGDRAIPLEPRPNSRALSSISSQDSGSANSSTTSISTNEIELASLATSLTPTPTLLVLNLPSLIFSQTQDMHPLFYPFGRIKKLSPVEAPSDDTTSVIVEYETAVIAQEAKETLHGQFYVGHEIHVHYVRHKSALLDLAPASDAPLDNLNATLGFDFSARQSLLGPVTSHPGFYQARRLNNNFQYSGFRAPHPPSGFNFRQRHILGSSPVNSRRPLTTFPSTLLQNDQKEIRNVSMLILHRSPRLPFVPPASGFHAFFTDRGASYSLADSNAKAQSQAVWCA
ncbi:hypothetical protein C0992_004091 [Termitomyces sp. T32_za158]|nr:hypothetical protein C0992_004091 [Termitomyces sp. T32_za158]